MHLMEKPPRPSSHVANVPFELDELVVASLAKEPDERPLLTEWRDILERIAQQCDVDTAPRVARIFATPPAGVPINEDTPFPARSTPRPRDVTPPPRTPAPIVARKRFPRWAVVALVALPTIGIGVAVLTSGTRAALEPPPSHHEESIVNPPVEPAPLGSAAAAVEPDPRLSPAHVATPYLTAPAVHHHHTHVNAPTKDPTSTMPVVPATTEDDLLAPGSIPRDGSGSPGSAGSATTP